jgi:hypothetical protein
MSAFGAAGQLAARGASRRPDAVQAAPEPDQVSTSRRGRPRSFNTSAPRVASTHRRIACAWGLHVVARAARARAPRHPARWGCRRPTACESWGSPRYPGAGLSRHTVAAEQRELCCSRQALDACLFAASSRAVGHRHRKLELDGQPAGRVAAGDAGTVARKPALEIDCPTRVERAVAAAQQIHPRPRTSD